MEAMVVGLPKRIHWRSLTGDSNPSIKAALASHKQGYELSAALQAGMEWCTSESLLTVSYTHLTLPTNREV